LRDWEKALDDATKTTEIKPDWAKGWGRKGAALHGMGNLGEFHLAPNITYDNPQLTVSQLTPRTLSKRL
jgi:hypothetical protein